MKTAAQLRPGHQRVLVFIPSYGDRRAIPDLLATVQSLGPRFRALVVDDGSSEPVITPELASQCLYTRLPANFGLGVSTQIAFGHALAHGYVALVRVDADGQHAVEDIPALLRRLDTNEADIVIGARLNHLAKGQLGRSLVKRYYSFIARLLAGGVLPEDVNSGFFAIGRAGMEMLGELTLERFPEPELFIQAARRGLRVAAVDVEQHPRREGASSLGLRPALQMFFRFNVFALERLLRRGP